MAVETLHTPGPIVTREQPTPAPRIDDFYTSLYQSGEKSDSPDKSRVSMARRMRVQFGELGPDDSVVSLGSGPQVIERQYLSAYRDMTWKTVTLDFAQIVAKKLLAKKQNINHTTAKGEFLPFQNESFSGAISNMALDFMPERAFAEIYRVLKPGSPVIVNLHHPDMIPDNLEELNKNGEINPDVYNQWKYLKENNILFSSPEQIRDKFQRYGFRVERVALSNERDLSHEDKWWEVDLIKPKS